MLEQIYIMPKSKFPEEVLTVSKSGKVEARAVVSRGKYVLYKYLDPETGKETGKKQKLVLQTTDGTIKQWFVIPMAGSRNLMIETELKEPEKKVWNEKTKKVEKLF